MCFVLTTRKSKKQGREDKHAIDIQRAFDRLEEEEEEEAEEEEELVQGDDEKSRVRFFSTVERCG
jgi:hypothetical protein